MTLHEVLTAAANAVGLQLDPDAQLVIKRTPRPMINFVPGKIIFCCPPQLEYLIGHDGSEIDKF